MTTETAIEAMLNSDSFFTCQLKGVRMEKAACVIRRRNALTGWIAGSSASSNKPGAQDTGCRDCEQGKQIAKEVSPGQVKAYQMRVGGSRKWDKKAMAKPGQITEPLPEPAGKVCSRKECKHEGRPQAADNFHKGSRADGLCGYCKDCQRDLAEERKKKLADLKADLRERLDRAAGVTQEQLAEKQDDPSAIPAKICPEPNCVYGRSPQPLDNFYNNKNTTDGKAYFCKACMIRKQKVYDQKRRDLLAIAVKSYPVNAIEKPPQEGKAKTMEQKQEITEKICRSDRCAHAGEAQPIENFMRSKMSPDGYMHLCKVCYRIQAVDRVGLKARSGKSLELRFDDYPELMTELAKQAKSEFRTVQAQAMMILQRALGPQG